MEDQIDILFNSIKETIESLKDDTNLVEFYHMDAYTYKKTDDGYTITYVIPGAEKEDISLNVDGTLLSLQVNKNDVFQGLRDKIWIPDNVSTESVEAEYKNGILVVSLPFLKEGRRTNTIEIK